ncbi:DUF6318 family protein [Citricoccus nitrophenolicus]|uniref:DUF6318 family protein n=1 Tax=Citricoccus nitrophenolicus TaxID=863575 RepID=A0ABV0IE75_9MICC
MAVSANRPVRLTAVAALSAVALLMTGCSGEAGGEDPTSAATEAATSPSSSETTGGVSGSPSASPSASATGSYEPATSEGPAKNVPVPEMPEAVKEPTEEGLEAAVEYWWETSFYLRSTGDQEPMDNVSDPACAFCEDQLLRFADIYEQGSWVETEPSELDFQFTKLDADEMGGTTAFLLSEASAELYRSNGERVEDASGVETTEDPWTASAMFDDESGHWVLDDLKYVGQQQ